MWSECGGIFSLRSAQAKKGLALSYLWAGSPAATACRACRFQNQFGCITSDELNRAIQGSQAFKTLKQAALKHSQSLGT